MRRTSHSVHLLLDRLGNLGVSIPDARDGRSAHTIDQRCPVLELDVYPIRRHGNRWVPRRPVQYRRLLGGRPLIDHVGPGTV